MRGASSSATSRRVVSSMYVAEAHDAVELRRLPQLGGGRVVGGEKTQNT